MILDPINHLPRTGAFVRPGLQGAPPVNWRAEDVVRHNPSQAPGHKRPRGSLVIYLATVVPNASGLWLKVGDGDTDWVELTAQPWVLPPVTQIYHPVIFIADQRDGGACLWRFVSAIPVHFPPGLAGSVAVARVPAAARTVLPLKSGAVILGTVTFEGGATVGTVAAANPVSSISLNAGDVIDLWNPPDADSDLADVSITLVGAR